MKPINILLILSLLLLGSCVDKDLNNDPTKSANLNPNFQLTGIELRQWGSMDIGSICNRYMSPLTQQMQGNWDATNYGGQYRNDDNQSKSLWNFMYQNQIKNIVDLVSRTDGDAGYANLNAIARIFKVYLFSILTDVYGDIPYFAAGTAYFSKDYYPKYDKQQDIYNDFFNELDEAVKALSADGGSADGDLIFKGDYQKWRRFGNSLRLRLALRLVQADANTARTQAEAAINNVGGVMTSGDIAMFNSFSDIYDTGHGEYRRNALAQIWQSVDNSPSPFLCETLFNYMWYGRAESNDNINFEDGKKLGSNWKPEYAKSSKKDPRTFVISRLYYHDDPHAQKQPFKRIDLTDELYNKQVSGSGTTRYFVPVPKGRAWYDSWPWLMASSSTIKEAYNESVAVQGGSCHPQLNNAFLKTNTPGIAMTYAETCFLLAEAKVRWNIAAIAETPEDLYNTGVNEAIRFLKIYDEKALAIPQSEIDSYLAANPLTAGTEVEQINMQLWILHLTNPFEAFANWRRSGFPKLTPPSNAYTRDAKDGKMPRRLSYPISESLYNAVNYQEAIERLGGRDDWTKPVWWDKNSTY